MDVILIWQNDEYGDFRDFIFLTHCKNKTCGGIIFVIVWKANAVFIERVTKLYYYYQNGNGIVMCTRVLRAQYNMSM